MNSINTALNFASTMAALSLPGIASDFYSKPEDNVTPLKEIGKIFTTVLSLVPFTGPLKITSSAITGGLNFVLGVVKPPDMPDAFLEWTNIAQSLAKVLEDFSGRIASAVTTTLNAPVNSSTGIDSLLIGGSFLGVPENFTESEMQSALIRSINVKAISLAFQAQKIFVYVFYSSVDCGDGTSSGLGYSYLCVSDGKGLSTEYSLNKDNGHDNGANLNDFTDLLVNKYQIPQEQFLIGPVDCWSANGDQQLADPFDGAIPVDPSTQCLFNVIVCHGTSNVWDVGIIQDCRDQGLPV
jgi:hypothetical protein